MQWILATLAICETVLRSLVFLCGFHLLQNPGLEHIRYVGAAMMLAGICYKPIRVWNTQVITVNQLQGHMHHADDPGIDRDYYRSDN